MRSLTSFAVAFLIAFTAAAQQLPSVDSRLAAQNALFADYWETNLKLNPTLATQVGDYRYNDKLGDFSLAAIARRHEVDQAFLTRIKAISTDGFGEEDRTSHDLLVRQLQESADQWDLKNYEMPVSAMGGPHTALADLRKSLATQKQTSPRLDVARFKELTGVSRKYAIPLLEYLDRERVTRRVGEARVIL